MKFLVQRGASDGVSTPGELFVEGLHYCYTLEPDPPIPAGTYDLDVTWSPRFSRLMPEVMNVPGYAGIRIHWGNWAKDTEGCTLVGSMEGTDFVGHSVDQFNQLFGMLCDALREGPQTITYADPTTTPPNAGSGAGGSDTITNGGTQ